MAILKVIVADVIGSGLKTKGRAFVSGAISQQAVNTPRQSPAMSSLGLTDTKGKLQSTVTAMTSYRANGYLTIM